MTDEDLRIPVDPDTELRLLAEADAHRLFELVDADRGKLRTWLDWVDDNKRVEDTLAFVAKAKDEFSRGSAVHLGLWHRDAWWAW